MTAPTMSAAQQAAYCEFASIGGLEHACVQGGVHAERENGVSLSVAAPNYSSCLRMSANEAHALARHLIAAADRYEALYGVTP